LQCWQQDDEEKTMFYLLCGKVGGGGGGGGNVFADLTTFDYCPKTIRWRLFSCWKL